MSARAGAAAGLGIGEVVGTLRPEFPDVTLSKIRFLESEGLIAPRRTASGYRRYTSTDVERLRFVLRLQRDHYLPLKVIRDQLEEFDPDEGPEVAAPLLRPDTFRAPRSPLRLTRPELIASCGLAESELEQLEAYGLIRATPGGYFDDDALLIATVAAELIGYGIQPRHLKGIRAAVDRELGLISQACAPFGGRPGVNRRARGSEAALDLAALLVRLHVALVRTGLDGRP